MVIGQSGTGKSTSLRNFKKGECSVINVSKEKPMPFPLRLKRCERWKLRHNQDFCRRQKRLVSLIDDLYLPSRKWIHEQGRRTRIWQIHRYGKELLGLAQFLHQWTFQTGRKLSLLHGTHRKRWWWPRTLQDCGKMLDNTVVCEGYCTVVFKTVVEDGYYSAHNNGYDTVKTPLGNVWSRPELTMTSRLQMRWVDI